MRYYTLIPILLLTACGGSSDGGNTVADDATSTVITVPAPEIIPTNIPMPVEKDPITDLVAPTDLSIVEGGDEISFDIFVEGEEILSDTLRAMSAMDGDNINVATTIQDDVINIRMSLGYDALPILPTTRNFELVIQTTDTTTFLPFSVDVIPTTAPDVYLTIGQSNMVGITGNVRDSDEGGIDAPDERIFQLNVERNADWSVQSYYTDRDMNINGDDVIVIAHDALYDPRNDIETIGLGLSFAKAALVNTTADIIIVPAAQSSSAFCDTASPPGHWNSNDTGNPNLGNTWLYDRAVFRTDLAIQESGGILRGILWHQGESDANDECAALYQENIISLVAGLRTDIIADVTTSHADVPFMAGTMSRGGDFADFGVNKTIIDDVHKSIADIVDLAGTVDNDDLVPSNGYACGGEDFDDCIHFGADALREMGNRYYDVLLTITNPVVEN